MKKGSLILLIIGGLIAAAGFIIPVPDPLDAIGWLIIIGVCAREGFI